MITLHTLTASNRRLKPKRVGRGNASGKGTTAGRGTKGQRARTGGRNKLIRRSMKHLIERTPKVRGFRSRRPKLAVVDLAILQSNFSEGQIVTPALLKAKGLIGNVRPGVKIIGNGPITRKLTIKADVFSKGAEAAVVKAGGTVVRLQPTAVETKATES